MVGIKYLSAGDRGLTIELGSEISDEVNRKVEALDRVLTEAAIHGITETVPTYRSLTVYYDPCILPRNALLNHLKTLVPVETGKARAERTVLELPVLYGGEMGPDLPFVVEYSGMSEEEVIRIHASKCCRIHMLGFTPGFPYLGGMDPRIAAPRLETPRTLIPAGSVGIAGSQTGIYPSASPGGWRLIGRTPVRLYDPRREKPILPEAGRYIRFVPVTEEEYRSISREIEEGLYVPVWKEETDGDPD